MVLVLSLVIFITEIVFTKKLVDKELKWAFYIGDFSFALTGSITAGQTGMDLLGCMVCGWVTATGGTKPYHGDSSIKS